MPNGRFGRRKAWRKRPDFCKAPPDAMPPGIPINHPPELCAMARWVDLDPLAPTDMAAYIDLNQQGNPSDYAGQNPLTGHRLRLNIVQTADPLMWDVYFSIWDQWRDPETHEWTNVPIDPNRPFDTGLLYTTFVPNIDYRLCQIKA